MLAVARTVRHWLPLVGGTVFGLVLALWPTLQASALLPGLFLTSVTNGAVVSGTVPLWASADAAGFSSIQFEVSGQAVGPTITAGPCVATWDTRNFSEGAHTVTAVARDSAGASVWAPAVLVTVSNATQTDTTPPTVSITSPGAGSSLSGTVTVFANASDNVAVSGVWFTLDGATVTTEMAAPQGVASWTWATGTATIGSHIIAALARDAAGNIGTSAPVAVTVTTTADTTPPTVDVTSPAAGASVSGTVVLSATASDNTGIAGVRFTVDGTPVGSEDLAAPFQVSWNSVSAANGPHAIRAVARDPAGNSTTSAAVTITANNTTPDTTAPTVTLTTPIEGTTVSGTVTVAASAVDNVGVTAVQFTLDGANLGSADTAAPFQITWSTTGASNGSHTVAAVARDAAGNVATSEAIPVTVSNATTDTTRPTVSLTAPAFGATVSANVTVSANASDNIGVVGVQFTVDGIALGAEDTTAPYQVTWDTTTVGNGARVLHAVARDAAANTRTSSSLTVVVNNTVPDTVLPTVTITAPTAGGFVAGDVTLAAAAGDNVGIAGVQFKIDGVNVGPEDTSAPYTAAWNVGPLLNGPRTMAAVARDTAGNTATAVMQVLVRNLGSGVAGDFDGDGYPDLLFSHTSGNLYTWFMRNSTLVGERFLTPATNDVAWQVVSIDDFDGDRKSDVLWQHTATGHLWVWFMDGTTLIGGTLLSSADTPWRVSVSGDLNGDGKTDLVWQHPGTGELHAWFLDGTTLVGSGPLTPGLIDPSWRIAGAADIDRDGRADLVWQNAAGALSYWLMEGLTAKASGLLNPGATNPVWQLKAVADFNRDGAPDLVWQQGVTGDLYIWYMNGSTLVGDGFITPSRINPAWQIVGGR